MKSIILLHGALGDKAQVQNYFDSLKEFYNCYSFSFYGHGQDATNNDEFTIDQFTLQLKEFIESNNLLGCSIFGYSMGGYVALNLAKKFPHCVENIVTYGTQFKWTPESATKEAQLLNPEKIDLKVPAFAKQLKTTHGSAWKEVVNKTKKMMLDLGNEPTLKIDDFETISHHILLTLGAKDNMADLEETLHVNRTLQDSQFMPIPNMPHPLNQVKPEVLVPLLLKHL